MRVPSETKSHNRAQPRSKSFLHNTAWSLRLPFAQTSFVAFLPIRPSKYLTRTAFSSESGGGGLPSTSLNLRETETDINPWGKRRIRFLFPLPLAFRSTRDFFPSFAVPARLSVPRTRDSPKGFSDIVSTRVFVRCRISSHGALEFAQLVRHPYLCTLALNGRCGFTVDGIVCMVDVGGII